MTFKGHSRSYRPALGRLDILPEAGKVGYTCFQTKLAKMFLRVKVICDGTIQ